MRITKDTLLSIARETAEKTSRRNRDVVSIYLTGSLLGDVPLLGGTADIDLVYVHATTPPLRREIQRLNDDIHLDIIHLGQAAFVQPRGLRKDPFLGSQLSQLAKALYDTNHWFEFVQSSAGAQFMNPENIIGRSRACASEARSLWTNLSFSPPDDSLTILCAFLRSLEMAANSLALLTGLPLSERRFIQHFPERALAIGRPDFSSDLLSLYCTDDLDAGQISALLPDWKSAFIAGGAQAEAPACLAPQRVNYYEAAIRALSEGNAPAAWWPMIRTWARAASLLPPNAAERSVFEQAVENLGLGSDTVKDKLSALDAYLDSLEELLDHWSEREGV